VQRFPSLAILLLAALFTGAAASGIAFCGGVRLRCRGPRRTERARRLAAADHDRGTQGLGLHRRAECDGDHAFERRPSRRQLMFRIGACALLLAAFAPAMALAQAYPAATPAARTTAPAHSTRWRASVKSRSASGVASMRREERLENLGRRIRSRREPRSGGAARLDRALRFGHRPSESGPVRPAEASFADAIRLDPGFAAAARPRRDGPCAGDITRAPPRRRPVHRDGAGLAARPV